MNQEMQDATTPQYDQEEDQFVLAAEEEDTAIYRDFFRS